MANPDDVLTLAAIIRDFADEDLLDVAGLADSILSHPASRWNACPHLAQGDSGSNYCRLAEQGVQPAGRPPLPPGTVIQFMDMEATVVRDKGGKYLYVKHSDVEEKWEWVFEGSTCKVINMPAKTAPLLTWSEERKPCEDCRYNHRVAETTFGRFVITWHKWESYAGVTVDETPWGDDEWFPIWDSADEAMAACENEYRRRLLFGPILWPLCANYGGRRRNHENRRSSQANRETCTRHQCLSIRLCI